MKKAAWSINYDSEWFGYIECTECIMTGPVGKLKKDAVDAWNRRADNA